MCAGGSVFVRDWLYTSALVALKRRVLRFVRPAEKMMLTGYQCVTILLLEKESIMDTN